jgi:serine/threonine protein phosphatase PrpC
MALAQEAAVRSCTGDGFGGSEFMEEGAMGSALRRVFHAVDQEILDRARAEGGRDGATALVVLRIGSALFTAHAGDSRAVLCRNRTAFRLTEDHKPNLPKVCDTPRG